MRFLFILHQSLTVTALGATLYLYYYTIFCGWKWRDAEARVLFLADPQIEGDAKIVRQGKRGEIDVWANDIYLRHIYTSFVSPYSLFTRKPTHTIVLGDLFSSQWIREKEFNKRVERYKWIFGDPKREYFHKFINLTGNHDIGYNWDINQYRVDRWKKEFGQMNFLDWIPSSNEKKGHRMSVINSMNVDGPALDEISRSETWSLLDNLAEEREQDNYQTPLVFLTHIPIYKEEGICVDGPMTIYDKTGNFIKEQNHLSQNSSEFILTKLRPKFIFAGHDHEGCDVTHVVRIKENEHLINNYRTQDFEKKRNQIISKDDYNENGKLKENIWIVREITVRSVMGEYGGNAGLFEINRQINKDGSEEFEYNYSSCPFVINHIPWIVAITDIIVILGWIIRYILAGLIHFPNRLKKLLQFQEKQKKKITRRNSCSNILNNIN